MFTAWRVPKPPGTSSTSQAGASPKACSAWVVGPSPLLTGPALSATVMISNSRWIEPSGRVRRADAKACTGP